MSKLSKALKKGERAVSSAIPHQHSAERRAALAAAAEQIEFYRSQRSAIEEEATRVKAESEEARRKVQEKQIRSMQRSYRAPGFMGETDDSMYQSRSGG